MATTTVIRNADVVVAWDASAGQHTYLGGADIAYSGGTLTFVGRGYDGAADEVVDGAGLMVMPGLVNIHSHPSSEPMNKGFTDEVGSPGLYNSSLYEYLPIFRPDAEAVPSCVRVALSELLLSGVTTVADLSMAHPGWLDLLAESGMRVCVAPMFRSARWYTKNGHLVEYEWSETAGEKAMEEALRLVERAEQHECGRLFGMVVPAQIDTVAPGLLKESSQEARARGLSWQIHAAQSVVEFHEITRRHGLTPIGWLDSLGVLNDRAIIGHGIFLDHHPSTPWHTDTDLKRLAETGTTVAHCPTVFARRGVTLKHFGRYKRSGVNMGLGTDTYPHNMLDEMRLVGLPGPHPGHRPALPYHHRAVRRRHGRRRAGARPRRHRPPRCRLPRGLRRGRRDAPDDAARPRPHALPDLRRRRPRAEGRPCGRAASGARRRGAHHGLPRRRRAAPRGAEARDGPRAVRGLGAPPRGADQPADLPLDVSGTPRRVALGLCRVRSERTLRIEDAPRRKRCASPV